MSDDISIDDRDRGHDAEHQRVRIDLAGYVLGGLTLAEQQAVEAHVANCPDCQAELADFEPLPVLLDLGGKAVGTSTPTAEPEPAVVPISSARSVGRRQLVGGVAAAIAIAAALLIGVVIGRPSDPSFSKPIALEAAVETSGSANPPSGTAALRPTEAGTAVRLDLNGLSTADGTYFECEWTSNQGTQSAGTFRADADGSAQVELLTAARRYPGWSLVIVEHADGQAQGTPVLQAQA